MTKEPNIWFDDIKKSIPLTNDEQHAIACYVKDAMQKKQTDGELSASLCEDASPRIVFVSTSNGLSAAQITMGYGVGIKNAIDHALSQLSNAPTQIRWIKLDFIRKVFQLKKIDIKKSLKIDRSLTGIAFNKTSRTAFLPESLLTHTLINKDGKLRINKIKKYLGLPAFNQLNLFNKADIDLFAFSTMSLFINGDSIIPLYRGHQVINKPDKSALLNAAKLAGNYLTHATDKNGKFAYSYRPKKNQIKPKYNILRHAGSIYAMLELYETTKNKPLLNAAERAINFLNQQIQTDSLNNTSVAYVIEAGNIKLGGNALAILALSKYTALTNNKTYLPLMQKLAEWIRRAQNETGEFEKMKIVASSKEKTDFVSNYYPGEAIFALTRLYQIDANEQWLDVAEKAAQHLILTRDKGVKISGQIHDHWLLYGLNELYRARQNPLFLAHALRIAKAIRSKQHANAKQLDWCGGFYEPPRTTPTSVRIEGLCAAYSLVRDFGEAGAAEEILETAQRAACFLLQMQFLPASSMHFINPQRAIGGFRAGLYNLEIRIDYVQHGISALLSLYTILSDSKKTMVELTIKKKENENCEILLLGDTSFGENYQEKYESYGDKNILKTKGYDYPLEKVAAFLNDSDLAIANLETPLTNITASPFKEKAYVHWSDVKNAPNALKKHNILAVSLANNHTFDYGKEGFLQTLETLKKNQISYFGAGISEAEAQTPLIIDTQFESATARIAIISCFQDESAYREKYKVYADKLSPGVNKIDIPSISKTIQTLKNNNPNTFVILFPHWGANYKLCNKKQKELAEQMVNAGADLIIGHGGHLAQEITRYDNTWVCFGIGNFMFNSKGRYEKFGMPGFSFIAKLIIKPSRTPKIDLQLYPILTNNRVNHYQTRFLNKIEFDLFCQLPYIKDLAVPRDNTFKPDQDSNGYINLPLNYSAPTMLDQVGSDIIRHHNKALWSPHDINKSLKGTWISGKNIAWSASGVCYYLSQVQPGDLVFVARKPNWGKNFSAKEPNIKALFEAGVAAIILDTLPKNSRHNKDQPIFMVEDTLEAMLKLASYARNRFTGKSICITGTVGKTTTKESLLHVLSKRHHTYASNKNFNHRPGVALSLTQTPANFEFGIYEFSVDLPKRTQPKALLAKPNIAIITTIQADHLLYYPTLEALARQKALLFEGLEPNGIIVLNRDDHYFKLLQEIANKNKNVAELITFGWNKEATVRCIDYQLSENESNVKIDVNGEPYEYSIKLPGRHMVMDSLIVIAVCFALKENWKECANTLSTLQPLQNRNKQITVKTNDGEFYIVDDTSNANPTSMAAAFELLGLSSTKKAGKKVAVLFDIQELGEQSKELHQGLAEPFLKSGLDKLYCIGEEIHHLYQTLPEKNRGFYAKTIDELIEALLAEVCTNDILLVKGSTRKSTEMKKIITALKNKKLSKAQP